MLGQKQKETNSHFVETYARIREIVSKEALDQLILETVNSMKIVIGSKKSGIAWSGGKDSVVLEFLCSKIRKMPSCIGMTDDLEYPEFMAFVTSNMPEGLKVYNSGQSLEWLSNNLKWLFPKTSNEASKWFKAIQHNAQNKFFQEKGLDILLTGRRKADMNYTGVNGIYKNKQTGVVRYSPIYKWSHEEVLACIYYYNLPLAPFYNWNNGWIVGSGCWPARQWTGSDQRAWAEVWAIDQSVVIRASKCIKSAEQYVRNLGI